MIKLHYTPKTYVCSCCGEAKTESEFYRESYTGQRTSQCKTCINVKRKVVRDKAKHNKFVSKERMRGMEEPDYTLTDWRDVMVHFGGSCAFCGKLEGRAKADKLDRDHLVPISKGGKTVRSNVIPACRKCNRGRGAKLWEEWYTKQPFYDAKRADKIRKWAEQ